MPLPGRDEKRLHLPRDASQVRLGCARAQHARALPNPESVQPGGVRHGELAWVSPDCTDRASCRGPGGTVVAIVGQPDERVRHGLVVGPSLGTSLLLAVVGSLAGALIVVCLVSVFAFLRYRLADDANWLCYRTIESGHSQFWIISNMPRFDVGAIGSLYACVKLPSGPVQVFLALGSPAVIPPADGSPLTTIRNPSGITTSAGISRHRESLPMSLSAQFTLAHPSTGTRRPGDCSLRRSGRTSDRGVRHRVGARRGGPPRQGHPRRNHQLKR